MTMWELLVHLENSGWTHQKLHRRAKKSDRSAVVPVCRDEPKLTWWTREGSAPTHTYLLARARATEILAAVLVESIEHLQPVSYYRQLLDGKIPIKG